MKDHDAFGYEEKIWGFGYTEWDVTGLNVASVLCIRL